MSGAVRKFKHCEQQAPPSMYSKTRVLLTAQDAHHILDAHQGPWLSLLILEGSHTGSPPIYLGGLT